MGSEKDIKLEKNDRSKFWFLEDADGRLSVPKRLHLPLKGEKPAEMKKEDWELLDRKTLGTIRLTLYKSIAFNIRSKTTTTSLMGALNTCMNSRL